MKIVIDNRRPEIKRIEHLLYGVNYEVWLNVYGPFDSEQDLDKALKGGVSKDAEFSRITPSSPQGARTKMMDMILYEGGAGHGPENLGQKREEIVSLMSKIFSDINLDEANLAAEFVFREGHPAYPVFWDFAYDIHSNGKRWIIVGSSSD
jgi:hypothetical protein